MNSKASSNRKAATANRSNLMEGGASRRKTNYFRLRKSVRTFLIVLLAVCAASSFLAWIDLYKWMQTFEFGRGLVTIITAGTVFFPVMGIIFLNLLGEDTHEE